MIIALFVLLATAFTVPIIAIAVVSVGSRLEDSKWTLSGPSPGPISALARRIVGFHARGIQWHMRGVEWQKPEVHDQDMSPESALGYSEDELRSAKPEWPASRPI